MELQISPSENLTRYILESNKFNKEQNRVRYSTFMPNPKRETSVYRIANLSDKEVWEIGIINVAKIRGKTLYGRADISVLNVLKQKLDVESSPQLHQRHANIVGWPQGKAEQISIATELAEEAQLHLKKNNNPI